MIIIFVIQANDDHSRGEGILLGTPRNEHMFA